MINNFSKSNHIRPMVYMHCKLIAFIYVRWNAEVLNGGSRSMAFEFWSSLGFLGPISVGPPLTCVKDSRNAWKKIKTTITNKERKQCTRE